MQTTPFLTHTTMPNKLIEHHVPNSCGSCAFFSVLMLAPCTYLLDAAVELVGLHNKLIELIMSSMYLLYAAVEFVGFHNKLIELL